MSLLPFGNLPIHTPRRFVPGTIDVGQWELLEPLFDTLDERVGRLTSAGELETWLLDWGELSAVLDEEASKRYIAMTCHTDDSAAEQAYLRFVEEIEPRTKPRQFRLEERYLGSPWRAGLSPARYTVFDRAMKEHVALFRPENVPLET